MKIWPLFAAGLLVAAPAAAQSPPGAKLPRIGYVTTGSPLQPAHDPFRQGLREAGYVEGSNVLIEARYAKGRPDRVAELVADVLQRDLDVLVVVSTQTALAAKKATTSVPTVFASVFDPVGAGIVASLARPGGNITGIAMGMGGGFGGKWVELLKEAVPGLGHAAVLWNPANESSAKSAEEIRAAARALNVKLDLFGARNAASLDQAFAAIAASRAQGLIVAPDPSFNANRAKLVQFAAKQRLPAVYFFKSFAEAGGLMAYGANNAASIRAAALYAGKILKGARPGDLPVEQPTRFDLVINLKTAAALGLKLPPSLLVRADEVIR